VIIVSRLNRLKYNPHGHGGKKLRKPEMIDALVDLIRTGKLCTPDLSTVRARPGRLRALTMQCSPQKISFCMTVLHGCVGRVTAQKGGSRRGQGPKCCPHCHQEAEQLRQWLSQHSYDGPLGRGR
jgi:hypothetical protein